MTFAALLVSGGEAVATANSANEPFTIRVSYFLNDKQKPIDECAFSMAGAGRANAVTVLESDRIRVDAFKGERKLRFRCGEHPTTEAGELDLHPGTHYIVFGAFSRPRLLNKERKGDEPKWSREGWPPEHYFRDARAHLRERWLELPESARSKSDAAYVWAVSTDPVVTTSMTFSYAGKPQPTTLPSSLAGSWNIVRQVGPPDPRWYSSRAEALVGKSARFEEATAEFGPARCPAATYSRMIVNPEAFFALVRWRSAKELGLNMKEATFVVMSCADAQWNGPTSFLVRDKNRVLAFFGEVFLEMTRDDF